MLADLNERSLPLYGLTNLPAEKFSLVRARLHFLDWFEAVVVSGAVGVAKPDPRIYQHLLHTCRLEPASTLYIDDALENVAGARALGVRALHFETPARLRSDLTVLGVL